MFKGNAEKAMDFYTSSFNESEKMNVLLNQDGTVLHGMFSIKGQTIMCIDSKLDHHFNFTPAMSLFVECDTADELEDLYSNLSQGGNVNMPITEPLLVRSFAG